VTGMFPVGLRASARGKRCDFGFRRAAGIEPGSRDDNSALDADLFRESQITMPFLCNSCLISLEFICARAHIGGVGDVPRRPRR
jgi:hypothetical protein